jgi:MoxR-like ATPase
MVETLNLQYSYTGKVQPKAKERDKNGQFLYPYLPSMELVEAVNLALYLERPLLLKGEPGCGKTRLARAVAYELNLPYEVWNVKSTSRAQDGLYIYDTVGRLRDAQLVAANLIKAEDIDRISDPKTYVRLGQLGRAFEKEEKTVVLIDEIDKADIDFPNDLLTELEQGEFKIEETGDIIRHRVSPLVIITSNDEKDLPDAFLRRCLFHYVEFPDRDRLVEIINARFQEVSEALINKAVTRFWGLRKEMEKDRSAGKKVSTSELIDWVRVLARESQVKSVDDILSRLEGKLPYHQVLLKSWEQHRRYLQQD